MIFTAQSYEMDAKKTADHFELPVWKVQAAFYYYEAFPKEIAECVSEDQSTRYWRIGNDIQRTIGEIGSFF